jgi:hypothetical protein
VTQPLPVQSNYWSNPKQPGLSYAGVYVDPLGFVHLQGFAQMVGIPGLSVFYLPPGERPSALLSFPSFDWTTGTPVQVLIYNDGTVAVGSFASGDIISFNGISFHP